MRCAQYGNVRRPTKAARQQADVPDGEFKMLLYAQVLGAARARAACAIPVGCISRERAQSALRVYTFAGAHARA